MEINTNKNNTAEAMDGQAIFRDGWIKKNSYYYTDLINFLRFNILAGSSILEIGCGTGYLLNALAPSRGTGIDISPEMIKIAKNKYPHLEFLQMDGENTSLNAIFDYVIVSDSMGCFSDIQKVIREIKKVTNEDSRIIITFHSFLWSPVLKLAELLRFKMPQNRLNWLNRGDIANLLYLEGFDIIKSGQRFLLPINIPIISNIFNKYIANLPLINRLCLTGYLIVRKLPEKEEIRNFSASIIIPARNEKGNIESAVKRIPLLGAHTEIIFVEGHSTDGTLDEIKRVCYEYKDRLDVKFTVQDGRGKGDAVRKGFNIAKGDILIILDADLTMPPEELPKFYEAIASGRGEYINGSRLVYPMEDEAMRTLNILGNKFFSVMFSWLLGQRLKDTLCGTKVISKKNYEKLIANRNYFGEFDPFGDFDLIFGAAKLNLKIVEVPIRYKAREYGETNISRFKHGWLLLKMVVFAMNKIKFL